MPSRSPTLVLEVKDKVASEFNQGTSLCIVSMHKDHFATVHGQLPPSTPITESSIPLRVVVQHYEARVQSLEKKYAAQKARHDRLEQALAEANAVLHQHSLALQALKEKLGVD